METTLYHYKATITSVYDGDTVTAEVDLGFYVHVTEKLRLTGIDTPELRGSEREQGLISRDRLRELVLGKEVLIKTEKDKKGKYGRFLATIYLAEGDSFININQLLVNEGLAEWRVY